MRSMHKVCVMQKYNHWSLLNFRMWYLLHGPYTMNRHSADLWMCLLIFRNKLYTKVGDYLYRETNCIYHLSGDMNLTYMCVYMYVNKMIYSGSAKMVKNCYQLCHYWWTSFSNIHKWQWRLKWEVCTNVCVMQKYNHWSLLHFRMWYLLHGPYTMNRHNADQWMCLLILIMDC
jgi:hypothetical protein